MRYRSKLTIAALSATVLLAIAVGGATASRLSVNERNFEFIWSEALGGTKTKLTFTAGTRNIFECRVTLLGRFTESTIKKEPSTNQATIHHGELESCANGTDTIKSETMPWNIRYRSFEGSLPTIRSVTFGLIKAAFRMRESGGTECEWMTELNHPAVLIAGNSSETSETGFASSGEPENITAERSGPIPLGGEGLFCAFAGSGTFGGTGLIRNLARTRLIRITLI